MIQCPHLSTDIAKFIAACACHVVATLWPLNDMSTLGASFVFKVCFKNLCFIFLTLSIMNRVETSFAKYLTTRWTGRCLSLNQGNKTRAILNWTCLKIKIFVDKNLSLNSFVFFFVFWRKILEVWAALVEDFFTVLLRACDLRIYWQLMFDIIGEALMAVLMITLKNYFLIEFFIKLQTNSAWFLVFKFHS